MIMKSTAISLIFTLIPIACISQTKISCDPPNGLRVDYYEQENIFKNPSQIFIPNDDKISGMNPKVIFNNDGKTAIFTVGNSSVMPPETITSHMIIFYTTQEQISFVGIMNGAPVLASYYPPMKILVYSQQTNWTPFTRGVRSALFYSKCKES